MSSEQRRVSQRREVVLNDLVLSEYDPRVFDSTRAVVAQPRVFKLFD